VNEIAEFWWEIEFEILALLRPKHLEIAQLSHTEPQ